MIHLKVAAKRNRLHEQPDKVWRVLVLIDPIVTEALPHTLVTERAHRVSETDLVKRDRDRETETERDRERQRQRQRQRD